MTDSSHPYAGTRAASLLSEGLKRYTAQHPGGLRALAADLEIKQGTVLSHMGNGRIGIPLDRAREFAVKLDMDVADFCLAVLEQRAPEVYEVVEGEVQPQEGNRLADRLREMLRAAKSRNLLTDEHVEIIGEVLSEKRPSKKWMRPLEDDVIEAIRERYPDGLSLQQSRNLIDWIAAEPNE